MKLGWLVWRLESDEFPVLMPNEPDWCHRSVQIVYAEVVTNG
jgi:hypothetical protein